jgi:hypothetical protein
MDTRDAIGSDSGEDRWICARPSVVCIDRIIVHIHAIYDLAWKSVKKIYQLMSYLMSGVVPDSFARRWSPPVRPELV